MPLGTIIKIGKDILKQAIPFVGPITDVLSSGNRQDKANAAAIQAATVQYERALEMAEIQWERQQSAATTAFQRSQEDATTQWGRSQQGAAQAWQWNKQAAAVSWQRSQQAAETAWNRSELSAVNAYNRSIDAYKKRYQWTVRDMRKAGLNPILAASGGFQIGSNIQAPAASATMASAPNYSGAQAAAPSRGHVPMASAQMARPEMAKSFMHNVPALTSSALNVQQALKVEREIEKVEAEIGKVKHEAKLAFNRSRKALQEIAESRSRQGVMKKQELHYIAQIGHLEAKALEAFTHVDDYQSQIRMRDASIGHTKALVNKINKEMQVLQETHDKLKFQISKLRQVAKAYDGPLGPILGHLSALLETAGQGIGLFLGLPSRARGRIADDLNAARAGKERAQGRYYDYMSGYR